MPRPECIKLDTKLLMSDQDQNNEFVSTAVVRTGALYLSLIERNNFNLLTVSPSLEFLFKALK